MSKICDKILDLLIRNQISSVETADALDKTGIVENIYAMNPGHFVAGKVHYVYSYNESNWPLHEQIQDIPEGRILFVDLFDCGDRAIFGDIVCKYLALYKRTKAIVVNGRLRDAHRLRKENYPIWLTGVTPKGCFNTKVDPSTELLEKVNQRKKLFNESLMVCDDSGITHISNERMTEETYSRLEFIELQEDIWYYCTDTLKWSTFETICLKKYLSDLDILPKSIRERLEKYINLGS